MEFERDLGADDGAAATCPLEVAGATSLAASEANIVQFEYMSLTAEDAPGGGSAAWAVVDDVADDEAAASPRKRGRTAGALNQRVNPDGRLMRNARKHKGVVWMDELMNPVPNPWKEEALYANPNHLSPNYFAPEHVIVLKKNNGKGALGLMQLDVMYDRLSAAKGAHAWCEVTDVFYDKHTTNGTRSRAGINKIKGREAVKLSFDYDYTVPLEERAAVESVVLKDVTSTIDIACARLSAYGVCPQDFVILSASGEVNKGDERHWKFSFHIILADKVYFRSMSAVVHWLELKRGGPFSHLWATKERGGLDKSIYGRNRKFRVIYASKEGQNRPLMPCNIDGYGVPADDSFEYFLRSLVSHMYNMTDAHVLDAPALAAARSNARDRAARPGAPDEALEPGQGERPCVDGCHRVATSAPSCSPGTAIPSSPSGWMSSRWPRLQRRRGGRKSCSTTCTTCATSWITRSRRARRTR